MEASTKENGLVMNRTVVALRSTLKAFSTRAILNGVDRMEGDVLYYQTVNSTKVVYGAANFKVVALT